MCNNQSSIWSSTSLAWKTWIPGKPNQKLHMSYWKLQLKQHEATTHPHFFMCPIPGKPDHSYPLKKRRVFLPSSLWEYLTLQLQRLRDDLELGSSLSRLRELHPVPNGTPPYPSVPSHGTFRPKPTLDGLVWGCFGSEQLRDFFMALSKLIILGAPMWFFCWLFAWSLWLRPWFCP